MEFIPVAWTAFTLIVGVLGAVWGAYRLADRWNTAATEVEALETSVDTLKTSVVALTKAVDAITSTQRDIQTVQTQAALAAEQSADNAAKLDAIYRELTVNGGETVKDRVITLVESMEDHGRRMDEHVDAGDRRHASMAERLAEVAAALREHRSHVETD